MFTIHKREMEWGGRKLVLETGRIARQADGAVLVTYGDTQVLCTAVYDKQAKPGIDFFPLTVHYQEKTFAAGRIPGGFFKREGRPSEKEVLTSRLIDRPIRPLFADGFRNETQVITTVLSHDMENDPDIAALIGASAALTLSGAPFLGPIGAARVGYNGSDFILNPTPRQLASSQLDLVVAGTQEGVLMVESQAQELSEEQMLDAVIFGHTQFQAAIDLIIDLAEAAAKEPYDLPAPPDREAAVKSLLWDKARDELTNAYTITAKQARVEALSKARDQALSMVAEAASEETQHQDSEIAGGLLKKLESDIVRGDILRTGKRIDGRTTTDIRAIDCQTALIARAHGSALFTRGETQALAVATLGTGQDEQIIDALEGEYRERFMLHYNFPPFSVGETGRFGSPGRREIGHGKLAWRAIRPLLPSSEDFPYTIRLVSEVTESNGSSSMATVCGSSMALMDAGVPLPRPCAGIAMGLIKEGDDFAVLSDILGDEDHLGDMDFKVAGTEAGITALQMDIKITSITPDIMRQALAQAADGRKHILGEMAKAITSGRETVSSNAPRIFALTIPKDKIREVIGTGGKVIRELQEQTGAKIDIEDDGQVKVSAVDEAAVNEAVERIQGIVAEPEAGRIYRGKVVRLMEFGAFVNFLGARDGLVHISELAEGRTREVSDVVEEGQEVYVKCLGADDRGKVRLSMRLVDQESGEELPDTRPPRPQGGGRDGGRDGGGRDGGGRDGGDRRPRRR